ncbi:hypothetical protein AB0M36_16725 [Actinoplanes sp. NPDC051346]|uniref:hypothetical protein n=1 Tax=Actinoplanes sp. NPDC051346 TaxID=3155048 RepID=UPI00341AC14C
MAFDSGVESRQGWGELARIAGGWAALVAVFVLLSGDALGGSFERWGLKTLVVAAVTGAVAALVVIDAVRTRRTRMWSRADRIAAGHIVGQVLGGVAWLLGGLLALLAYATAVRDYCSGTGGNSFECMHRPGELLSLLGVVVATAPTAVLVVLIALGRRSRVIAWLSPVLIVAAYVLAIQIWQPHEGFGVPERRVVVLAPLSGRTGP